MQHFANSQGERQSGKKIEGQVIDGLLGKFLQTRRKVVELMVDVFSKTSIENLPLRLQEDEWRIVSIPNRYYSTLGEVVFGNTFSKRTSFPIQTYNQYRGSFYQVLSYWSETRLSS